jgi:hypothetical protein
MLGYGTLSVVNSVVNSVWHSRFKQSQRSQFEDILVTAIATVNSLHKLIVIWMRDDLE